VRFGRQATAPVDWLVVGLGNPGSRYAGTPHNVGFEVADALARRWDLPAAKKKFNGLVTEGRAGIAGPRVAVLLPQTFMNEAGRSAGPARGAYRVEDLEHVLVLHDEIDLPFGDVRTRAGGGLARSSASSATRASPACASESAGRTRPTPRSSPPTSWASGASRAARSRR
jgi:PTH1 family peptidyl-tRNA hydrolase